MKKALISVYLFIFAVIHPIYSQTTQDFNVTLNKAGDGVVITGYTGKATTVRIPAQIDGLPVKEIGTQAFSARKDITNIVVPSNVTSIGDDVFALCSKLTTISLPDSLVTIGKNAFMHSGLTSITIPKNIISINEGMFFNCRQLKSVTINGNITEIKSNAFASCISLTEIKLPASIQVIGDRAFLGCDSLYSVIIPNTAGSIKFGEIVFGDGKKLNLATQALLKQRGYVF